MIAETWINEAEARISDGTGITMDALKELRRVLRDTQQHLLYIWSAADSVNTDVLAWNYFGPFETERKFDPKNECPYDSVRQAMADGWRVVSFPSVEYPMDNAHNQLGHEFILERYFANGDGLPETPHGKRLPSEKLDSQN